MKRLKSYLVSAVYNIKKNKGYAFFYIISASFTFIFIGLIIQLTDLVLTNNPPLVNADRIVRLTEFKDMEGRDIGGIPSQDIKSLLNDINDYSKFSICNTETTSCLVNDQVKFVQVGFVNDGFWDMHTFDFIDGRGFTYEESSTQEKVIVIVETLNDLFYNGDGIGKTITVQGNEHRIIGVIADFSILSSPSPGCNMWIPYKFNKFIPSYGYYYTLDILFPEDDDMFRDKVQRAVNYTFNKRNIAVNYDLNSVLTVKDININNLGGGIFKLSIAAIILILLVIPSLNIIAMNIANVNDRAKEISIRRAMGASRLSSFMQIIIENLLLVLTGAIVGLFLTEPGLHLIQYLFFKGDFQLGVSLISKMNYYLLLIATVPMVLAFTFLSGAFPAFVVSRLNISTVLKGGEQ